MKVLYNTHYLGNFTRNHTTDIFCQILSNKPGAQSLIAVDMIFNLTKCNTFNLQVLFLFSDYTFQNIQRKYII